MSAQLNHLAGQKSPYLLQHMDNPVDWYPWGQQAFDKAKNEQKPILLSIGYSTCHWCHVMAHESFENQDIADVINKYFVAIKVDREERPDLDQIYMTATMAMTGQGGWPLTVFLTPQTKPFYGGTYFPPFAKWGSPGFMELLKTIVQAWRDQREQLLSSSEEITQSLLDQARSCTSSLEIPDQIILETAYRHISSQFDCENGGFGNAPKFSMGHQLSFLLRYYKRSGEKKAMEMVESTLMAIAKGGICDHLGGGFHRYSTDAHWHVPHFEKMLYDQAILAKVYLEGYQLTGLMEYARVARKTLDYILRDMQQSEGGFYCAEDADSMALAPYNAQGASTGLDGSHKTEGAFYVWSQQEINQLLSEREAEIFNYAYGVVPEGNAKFDPHGEFVGKNILYLAHSSKEAAAHLKMEEDEVKELLEKAKQILFQHRNSRPRPHLDDKILTDWNGLMLGALAFGGMVLNESCYIVAAQRAADFILFNMKSQERLLHRWRDGQADISGTLEDYAFFINGLLDLYEANFEEKYYIEAQILAEQMIILFEDKDKGGFFLTAQDAPMLIMRPKDIYDGAIPSGNSVAAYVLVRLYLLTSQAKWINSAEGLFKAFTSSIEKAPSGYTFALCAFDFYIGPSLIVTLEGSQDDSKLAQMHGVVYKHFIPNKSVLFRPGQLPAVGYVCRGNVCQKPTQEISEFESQLLL